MEGGRAIGIGRSYLKVGVFCGSFQHVTGPFAGIIRGRRLK